jgi:hypothetical protein
MKFDEYKKYAVSIDNRDNMIDILKRIQKTSEIRWMYGEKPTEYIPEYKRNSLVYWPKSGGLCCNSISRDTTWLTPDGFIRMCSQFFPKKRSRNSKKTLFSFDSRNSHITVIINDRIVAIHTEHDGLNIEYINNTNQFFSFFNKEEKDEVYYKLINAWSEYLESNNT